MSQTRSIIEPHQASINHSSVVEFANIIATPHNSESSNQSCSPTPGSPLLHLYLYLPILPPLLKTLFLIFFNRNLSDEGGQEHPAEFIENRNLANDGQTYTDENRKLTPSRVIVRMHLRDKALLWYHGLGAGTRELAIVRDCIPFPICPGGSKRGQSNSLPQFGL